MGGVLEKEEGIFGDRKILKIHMIWLMDLYETIYSML
jgi:hypothetical protein